jgi:hypothetical protein
MFSDWYSDILNPKVDGEEKHIQAFEKFGLKASISAAPHVIKLETQGAVDGFIHDVGNGSLFLALLIYHVTIRYRIRRPGF